jgi:natural product biosynthesis luciferase-like monooxygenase protein
MEFGIMFFSSGDRPAGREPYRLLIEAARWADAAGFSSVWTPERHFGEFGGLFPNPSVTSAALATITDRIQLRAGSLISPLHHVVRIAEEWSVVDNLSGGRTAISFGSGWNVTDFVFFPDRYVERRAIMFEQIEAVKALWRGEPMVVTNTFGKEVEIGIRPRPIQKELPVWVTSSGNEQTFVDAGRIGANVLTHLIGQDLDALGAKIARYRDALQEGGFARRSGQVTLMLHTFLGTDPEAVKALVRPPFREYLRSAVKLELSAAQGGGVISGGLQLDAGGASMSEDALEQLLDITFERYYHNAALMGTPDSCQPLLARLIDIGVDEVACLIDFLPDDDAVLGGLEHLDALRRTFSEGALRREAQDAIEAFTEDL